jgi:4-carboxymuconolactone decarboxylase
MPDTNEPSGAQKMFGDFAPALVHFTDDVLFGEVWTLQSSPRRSAASSPSPASPQAEAPNN